MRWFVVLSLLLALVASAASAQDFDRREVEEAAIRAIDSYLAAFNTYDAAEVTATLHFPAFRLAGNNMVEIDPERAQVSFAQTIQALLDAGWHHSVWDRRDVVHAGPSKVHFDAEFTRYREDGSVIGT